MIVFFLTGTLKIEQKSDYIILLTLVSREVISCCLSECALYSDRIPNVAPEAYLLISHGAALKLQSTQSRCGFQALTHAEKLQLIHACRLSLFCCIILVFSRLKSVTIALSCFSSPAELIFSCFSYTLPETSAWPQSTASCEGPLQPISGRGTTCDRRGHLFKKLILH